MRYVYTVIGWCWRHREGVAVGLVMALLLWASHTDPRTGQTMDRLVSALSDQPSLADQARADARGETGKRADAERTITRQRTELETQRNAAQNARARAETAEATLIAEQGRNAALTVELDRMRFRPYRGQTVYGPAVVHDSVARLRSALEDIATRESTTMAAAGVPWFGVAVLVESGQRNAVALCQAASDLAALDAAYARAGASETSAATLCARRMPTPAELWAEIRTSPEPVWNRAQKSLPTLPPLATEGPLDIMFQTIDGLNFWLSGDQQQDN